MIKKIINAIVYCGRGILRVFGSVGKLLLKSGYWALVILIPLSILWYLIGVASLYWQYSDKDEYRGAASITEDLIDEPLAREKIRYLSQNWTQGESLWFYNITQGSNLLPYDFFMALEQKNTQTSFRDNAHINKFRYLPQVPTKNNPDGLPVGMVKDEYNGKTYMGFNCAACHTSQINYQGIGLRIDGGPAATDMENFLITMLEALQAIQVSASDDPGKKERFFEQVLARGNYATAVEIDLDLEKYINRLKAYIEINHPVWSDDYRMDKSYQVDEANRVTHYGFSRLDAFGRIYNRVLQHIMDIDGIKSKLQGILSATIYSSVEEKLDQVQDQTNIFEKALAILKPEITHLSEDERNHILMSFRSAMYNSANAPVSYPYLWDISQHDYVQWTGLVSNGGIGPLGRNVGQVIGVFGSLDWQKESVFTLSSKLGGQGAGKYKIDFKSSINKVNLRRVENQLRSLHSPQWPEEYFPPIDQKLAHEGRKIFNEYCESCHKNIQRDEPTRRVITNITEQTSVKTDPVLASNTINYIGDSALLRNQYVDGSLGKLVIEEKMPVASLVKYSTRGVVLEADPDRLPIFRSIEWLWGILKSLKDNPVKQTAKLGKYDPATPKNPLSPVQGYKARSLNGIWATAPYLHNGSVPSLYELLLPKKSPSDPKVDESGNKIEYRSDQFLVGSREYDPVKVGFRSTGYGDAGFLFDTRLPGNSNTGHEYAAGRTTQPNGSVLKALTKDQRMKLLEYLKSL